MKKRPIGIGLVSVGWMGKVHSQAYRRVNYHFPELSLRPRLVVAADTVADQEQVAVDELGYEAFTDSWKDVVSHPDVEAVNVTAPNYLHREIALTVLEQGKHLWIEKPVGRSLAETSEVAAAAAAAGVMTAVGFNYRWAPAVEHARELIRSGAIGDVVHTRSIFLNDHASDPRGSLNWRYQNALSGSGVLGDLMSHAVDLLLYLVGPVSEVSAQTRTFIHERPIAAGNGDHFALVEGGELGTVENEDYAGALLRFAGGAVGSCEVSRVTVGPRCQIGFDVYGTDGAVSWDFERMNELRVCHGRSGPDHGYTTVMAGPGIGTYARFQPGPAISMGYDDLKVVEAMHFLRSIETGEQEGATVEDARATAGVLAAISRSGSSNAWEPVGP